MYPDNKVIIAASHNVTKPKFHKKSFNSKPKLIIRIDKLTIWKVVLYLANLLTGISVFNFAKNSLRPEIAISLNKIIIAGITWTSAMTLVSIKTMITAAIKSLSAIGSSKVPSLEDWFKVLAKYPSK